MPTASDSKLCCSSLRMIAALGFATYAAYSFFWAVQPIAWSLPMFVQSLLYLAVAVALWTRVSWAGWFAVGIATGGLAVDAVFPLLLGRIPISVLHAIDTTAQGALLAVSVMMNASHRAIAPARADRLTDGTAPRIGWTFALTAATLPAFAMAAVAPHPVRSCFADYSEYSLLSTQTQVTWLMLAPPLALLALRLLARVRTTGLLVLLATALGSAVLLVQSWSNLAAEGWDLHGGVWPAQSMAAVGQMLLFAALVPLAVPFARKLIASARR